MAEGSKPKERRRFQRFPVSIPLSHSHAIPHKLSDAHTKDISAQGLGFITNQELADDAFLDIYLNMPDSGEKIHVIGKVIWLTRVEPNMYRVGIGLKDKQIKPIPLVLRILQKNL